MDCFRLCFRNGAVVGFLFLREINFLAHDLQSSCASWVRALTHLNRKSIIKNLVVES
ncbi:MAG: hypothetical protein K2N75_05320 [Helicobacter sp.]|uniref:hypothetical protein n=1 Tax=Helicobacter sp. TaxID=218 RepID=UPI0023BD5AFA|nr:hypothetical protein [Helicobacter sp.]MDE7175446.1 hypothetical protein [Helicobacter sp.]